MGRVEREKPPGYAEAIPTKDTCSLPPPSSTTTKDHDTRGFSLPPKRHEDLAGSKPDGGLASRDQARVLLGALRTRLALDDAELACMLCVSPGAVGLWWRAGVSIAPETRARIIAAGAALDRLLALFTPESLAQAVRRRAELFDGKRALDWILAGRIAEVADRYDVALSYQA